MSIISINLSIKRREKINAENCFVYFAARIEATGRWGFFLLIRAKNKTKSKMCFNRTRSTKSLFNCFWRFCSIYQLKRSRAPSSLSFRWRAFWFWFLILRFFRWKWWWWWWCWSNIWIANCRQSASVMISSITTMGHVNVKWDKGIIKVAVYSDRMIIIVNWMRRRAVGTHQTKESEHMNFYCFDRHWGVSVSVVPFVIQTMTAILWTRWTSIAAAKRFQIVTHAHMGT